MNPKKVPQSPAELANQTHHSTIKYISFNQDYTRLAAGIDSGFCVFLSEPFHPLFRHFLFPSDSPQSGIGFVSMLFQSHMYAFVGSGIDRPYPRNKAMIWDNHQGRCIGELSFRSEVISVKIRRDRIVVILLQKIFVYNFTDLKLLHQIETFPNPSGICEISHSNSPMMLICPGLQKGQVRVENYGSKRTRFVAAHDSRVACISMTPNGGIMATASSKGTLVRIFNPLDGTLLQEVRRGADRTAIHSIAISLSYQWLAVSSEKGTVHVFRLKIDPSLVTPKVTDRSEPPQNSSSLARFKGVLPKYFSSEWSVAQFRLPEGVRYVVGFGTEKNTVVVAGMNGSFYRCGFDPVNGGDMQQLEYRSFINFDEMHNKEEENASVT